MRRGRQQDHVGRPSGQRCGGLTTVSVVCDTMRLVYDDDVPMSVEYRAKHLRPLDVIDGRDGGRPRCPGIYIGWNRAHALSNGADIDNVGVDAKAVAQLVVPLIAKTGRGQYEDALCKSSCTEFRDNEACLNRL